MANIHTLENGRSVVRRRSRPLAGVPLAPVVSLEAHRKPVHQETPAERAERLSVAISGISGHILSIIDLIVEARS
jgi:hypothetical protein